MMIKETLTASDYQVPKTTQSLIDEYARITTYTYKCPKCKKNIGEIKNGKSISCECGLSITMYGNSFECTLN